MKLLTCSTCGSPAHFDVGYPQQISCSAAMTGEDDACPNDVILRPEEWNRRTYPPQVQAVLDAAKDLEYCGHHNIIFTGKCDGLQDSYGVPTQKFLKLCVAVRALEEMDAQA